MLLTVIITRCPQPYSSMPWYPRAALLRFIIPIPIEAVSFQVEIQGQSPCDLHNDRFNISSPTGMGLKNMSQCLRPSIGNLFLFPWFYRFLFHFSISREGFPPPPCLPTSRPYACVPLPNSFAIRSQTIATDILTGDSLITSCLMCSFWNASTFSSANFACMVTFSLIL